LPYMPLLAVLVVPYTWLLNSYDMAEL
jgi:hypothetical protein